MRILVADDHHVVRKGVCSLLESRRDLEVCGEATNGEEAIQKSLETNPSLIILDVTMPVLDGFSAARKIKAVRPTVPILMLSIHDGPEMARSSRSVGAQGFITKAAANEVLLKAVDVLLEGGTFFPNDTHV
jgi:DNA-binding NarL/FixJ family response regulator